ncbi:uncharacterized mitochondrial protein AtMg00810-like [Cannabis sativa]|uniref:uncharacterized mitochondrial protein AtMg00810-like n=1 Tax=Cannabis sativa TaxID=3483 RepID=UPI0029CA3232|nr:uncharacterized mitochondrial protein AtMg00810-like [Cannabis sativa]
MSVEFHALTKQGTWTLVPYAPHMNVIDNKWVHKVKLNVDGASLVYLLVYVDDILINVSNTRLISNLNKVFSLKDLGPIHYFLGVEIYCDTTGMYLTQTKNITDLLPRLHMEGAKSCPNPTSSTTKLSLTNGEPFPDITLYRSTLGAL